MQEFEKLISFGFYSAIKEQIEKKEEILRLEGEIKLQKENFISEMSHPFRYYGRLLRARIKEKYGVTLFSKSHKEEQQKYKWQSGRSGELYRLWSSPRSGFSTTEIKNLLCSEEDVPEIATIEETIDVIIPIYNGVEHLRRLLPVMFKNTTQPHRFIFIDDCSPDPETKKFLISQIEGRKDCILIQNEKNLGFPGTVNHAAQYVTSPFFVILNTDVLVPQGWLERIITPFIKDPKVCTTTPFTNGGVFYSFPNFGADHKFRDIYSFVEWDKLFQRIRVKDLHELEFINGTGFCMGVRKKCWDKLGSLDAEAFGRGYGEETDLCLRYLDSGWKNVLVPNLFVYHNHGGTFPSEEKKALTETHLKIVQKRWQKYLELLKYYVAYDPWASYRLAVLLEAYKGKTDCLMVDLDDNTGGACAFRMQQEQKMLKEGKKVITLLYSRDMPTQWTLTFVNEDGRAAFALKDWEQAVEWIQEISPDEIKVNNLAFNRDVFKVLDFFEGNINKVILPYDDKSIPSPIITAQTPIEFSTNIHSTELIGLTFAFATYKRVNHVKIKVSLFDENNNEVFKKDIDTTKLLDNANYSFGVEINNMQDCVIKKIRISSDATDTSKSVSVYLNNGIPCYSYVKKIRSEAFKIPRAYCFHDFFSCCPSFFLLNKDNMFCNYKNCQECLPSNPQKILPYNDIISWREKWGKFIDKCIRLRFFSENTYNLVSRVYDIPKEKVIIKGHDPLVEFNERYTPPTKDVPLNIGVIGAWFASKGSKQVMELAQLLHYVNPDARIHFYGNSNAQEEDLLKQLLSNIEWKGRYKIKDLPKILSKDKISVIFFASVYPETYSFVTQECIDIGVPIVCFNIGASGDRVKAYEKGYIVEDFSPVAVYKMILKAREDQIAKLENS